MSERAKSTSTSSRATGIALVCLVVVGAFAATGCRKQLFRQDDTRSPYARYDSVRGQDVPPFRYNEFGRRVPNLRARLAPKE